MIALKHNENSFRQIAKAVRTYLAISLIAVMCVSNAYSQSGDRSTDSSTSHGSSRQRVWPLGLFGKPKKEPVTDPFVDYGDQQQRQLASSITGTPVTSSSKFVPPKNDRTLPTGSPYPWPAPVDSHNKLPTSRDVLAGTNSNSSSGAPQPSITERLRNSLANQPQPGTAVVPSRTQSPGETQRPPYSQPGRSDKLTSIPAITYPKTNPGAASVAASPPVRYPARQMPAPSIDTSARMIDPNIRPTATVIDPDQGNQTSVKPIQTNVIDVNSPTPMETRNTTWSSRMNDYGQLKKPNLGTTRQSQVGGGYQSAAGRLANSRKNPFFDPKHRPDHNHQNIQTGGQAQSSRRGWKDGVLVDPPKSAEPTVKELSDATFGVTAKPNEPSYMEIYPPAPESNSVDVPTPHAASRSENKVPLTFSVDVPTPVRPSNVSPPAANVATQAPNAQVPQQAPLDSLLPQFNPSNVASATVVPSVSPSPMTSPSPTTPSVSAYPPPASNNQRLLPERVPQQSGNVYESQPPPQPPQAPTLQSQSPAVQAPTAKPFQSHAVDVPTPHRAAPPVDHRAYDTREIEQDIWGGSSRRPRPSNPTPKNIPYLDGPSGTKPPAASLANNPNSPRSLEYAPPATTGPQTPLHVPDIKSPQLEIPSTSAPPMEIPQINLPSVNPPVMKKSQPVPPQRQPLPQPGLPTPNPQSQQPLALTSPNARPAFAGGSIYDSQPSGPSAPAGMPPTNVYEQRAPAQGINQHPSLSAPPRITQAPMSLTRPTKPATGTATGQLAQQTPAYPPPTQYPPAAAAVPSGDQVLDLETRPIEKPMSPEALSGLGSLDQESIVVAVIGDQSVLSGDLLWQINQMLAPHIGTAPEEELAKARIQIMERMLPKVIENKLVFMDFLRTIPRERFPDIESRIYKEFNKTKLPKLLEEAKLETAAELDAELRKMGSSVAKQQRLFLEQLVGQQMVQQNVQMNDEITHDDMLKYYYDHSKEYEHPATVKWERIMVRWSSFPNQQAAFEALRDAGNRIQLKGESFAGVAKEVSQGPNAADGGLFESTTLGSLKSQKIERAIFALPVGLMSKFVTDEDGPHIIRVIERKEAGRTPFEEVQNDIKMAIRKSRFQEQVVNYLDKLKKETIVQTIFDQPAAELANPISGQLLR